MLLVVPRKIASVERSVTVVGEKEKTNETVNVRTRDNKVHGEKSLEGVIEKFRELDQNRVLNSEEEWS